MMIDDEGLLQLGPQDGHNFHIGPEAGPHPGSLQSKDHVTSRSTEILLLSRTL